MKAPSKPKRILIVRSDRIGDVILSTPVIRNLRLAFPSSHIAFLCKPYTKGIVEKNPHLDEVIVYDKDKTQKGTLSSIAFSLSLRKKRFDWALILNPSLRLHLITFFAGISLRIGWNTKGGWLLTKRLAHTKPQGLKHELEYTLDILRALGIPVVDKSLYFPVSPEVEVRVKELLLREGLKNDEGFVVYHPSASCPSKRWPIEHFLRLINILQRETKYKAVVISSKEEKDVAKDLIEKVRVIDLRARLSLMELAALLKNAKLFISNDSGPVHIAASLNVPVISIFGRNEPGLSPRRWRPLGENSFYFHKDVGCRTCLAHNCQKGFLCLKAIGPEEIAKEALEIIYKRQ